MKKSYITFGKCVHIILEKWNKYLERENGINRFIKIIGQPLSFFSFAPSFGNKGWFYKIKGL